jgi:hypothetical protein
MQSLKRLAQLARIKHSQQVFQDVFRDCSTKVNEENMRHLEAKKAETRLHRETIRRLAIEQNALALTAMNVKEEFHHDILQQVLFLIAENTKINRLDRTGESTNVCVFMLGAIYVDIRDENKLVFSTNKNFEKYGIQAADMSLYAIFMAAIQLESTPVQMSISDMLFAS